MGLSAGSVLHIALALWCLPLLDRLQEKPGATAVHSGRPQAESRALFIVIMVMTIATSWLMLLGRSAGNVFIYFQF